MLRPLNLENPSVYQRTTLIAARKGTGLPSGFGLRQVKLLGKGSNNAVYLYRTRGEQLVVYRQPRRKSDTQRLGNATWEFRHTAIAAQLEVAPLVYDAWYHRHSTPDRRGGLHLVCEYYPKDLHTVLIDAPLQAIPVAEQLRRRVDRHLRTMADAHMLHYDLKPSNMVYRDEPLEVRFIDFGRDFCEWRPYSESKEHLDRAPVLSFLQTLADTHASPRYPAPALYADLIYALMVVLLSSNIGYTLDNSSRAARAACRAHAQLNFMAPLARALHALMLPAHISLVKQLLRQRDIRDTLRHYMGRRNCGTKRCFTYASFTSAGECRRGGGACGGGP